jgi:hypothetical protein
MKYLKRFQLFESEDIKTGWRTQSSENLHPTTGHSATEGEGYYIFDNKKEAENWFNTKYIFEIKYKQPIPHNHLKNQYEFLFYVR